MKWYAPLLTAALLAGGCHPSLPEAPVHAAEDREFSAPEAATPPGMADDAPAPFTLLAGDLLTLRVWSIDKSDMQLPVDAAGVVHVPLAGPIAVGGLELTVAEKRIEDALKAKDKLVQVSLSLAESSGHRATVVGAVEHPGEFALRPMTRVADLIAMSSGPKVAVGDAETLELSDLEGARVIRAGAALPLSVGKALEGDARHNIRVQAGDMIFVPSSRGQRISVLGEVNHPRVISYHRGIRLTEALAMAGGSNELADNSDVRVVRGSLSHPRVYCASLRALVAGESHDVVLEPGDVVFVTEHWFASVTQVVSRLTPFLAAGALAVAVSK